MPKVRTLVPLTHPTTGEQFAAGTEVDVAEDVFNTWRADGKVSSIDEEKAQAKVEGNYSARTGRAEAGGQEPPREPPKAADKKK